LQNRAWTEWRKEVKVCFVFEIFSKLLQKPVAAANSLVRGSLEQVLAPGTSPFMIPGG